MYVDITAKQIVLEMGPEFGDLVSSHHGRELFEATPILRPVTNYRGHSMFAGNNEKRVAFHLIAGGRRIKKEGTEGEDVGRKV
jgi:hypothetical protein